MKRLIGTTSAPEGAEPFTMQINDAKKLEPIEVFGGCIDFALCPSEARELSELLGRAAAAMGAYSSTPNPPERKLRSARR